MIRYEPLASGDAIRVREGGFRLLEALGIRVESVSARDLLYHHGFEMNESGRFPLPEKTGTGGPGSGPLLLHPP